MGNCVLDFTFKNPTGAHLCLSVEPVTHGTNATPQRNEFVFDIYINQNHKDDIILWDNKYDGFFFKERLV